MWGNNLWEKTLMWDCGCHRDLLGHLSCSHCIPVSQLLGNKVSAHLLPSSSLTGVKITLCNHEKSSSFLWPVSFSPPLFCSQEQVTITLPWE